MKRYGVNVHETKSQLIEIRNRRKTLNKRRDKRKDKTQETKRIKQTGSNVTTLP
jgi:hypothetical protein